MAALPLARRAWAPDRPRDPADAWLAAIDPHVQGRTYPPAELPFVRATAGEPGASGLPLIANVQVADYDRDGRQDLLVCDIRAHAVIAYTWNGGRFERRVLLDGLFAPAHCSLADIDGDGDLDLLVADLGDIFPNNEQVGRVVAGIADGGRFTPRVILDGLRRITDVEAADLDGDGDLDLAVAEFGQQQGSVFWLEQATPMAFARHDLLQGPGAIHVPLADYDHDGDVDIATVLSQDEEEVWMLANDGAGRFTRHLLFHDPNFDLGSGGLVRCDIDRDGDDDLLLPAGDNLERTFHYPQAYHGCYLLENRGGLVFSARRIADLPGTYAVAAGDLDGDGDIDLALVSMSNDFGDPGSASLVVLINDGSQHFTTRQVACAPIQLITCAIGDLDHDGRNDIAAGSLRIHPPYRDIEALPVWLRR
jgi:hypothetical protein